MAYTRRNFLKAAGTSAASLTTLGVDLAGTTAEAQMAPAPLGIRAPMTKETVTFTINGRPHRAEYEARTTLWEVIHNTLSMTGTNRSCNRATCGACSVLVDGEPAHRIGARCGRQRHLQRVRRSHPGASGDAGEDHGRAEGAAGRRCGEVRYHAEKIDMVKGLLASGLERVSA